MWGTSSVCRHLWVSNQTNIFHNFCVSFISFSLILSHPLYLGDGGQSLKRAVDGEEDT